MIRVLLISADDHLKNLCRSDCTRRDGTCGYVIADFINISNSS